MDWKSIVEFVAANSAVIWTALPVFLVILGAVAWAVFKLAQGFYAQEVKNAKGEVDNARGEVAIAKGLQALAEKERDIAKAGREDLLKKLSEKTPAPSKPSAPADVAALVAGQPAIRQAFAELNSTNGLHLPVDPRSKDTALYVALTYPEVEKIAAARFFDQGGLINVYKPDAMGTGVTVTASSTAIAAYRQIFEPSPSLVWPGKPHDPEKK